MEENGEDMAISQNVVAEYDERNNCIIVWERTPNQVIVLNLCMQQVDCVSNAPIWNEGHDMAFKFMPYSGFSKYCYFKDAFRVCVGQKERAPLELSSRRIFSRRRVQQIFWLKEQTVVVVYVGEVVVYRVLFPIKDMAPIVDYSSTAAFGDTCSGYEIAGDYFMLVGGEGWYLFTYKDRELSFERVPECEHAMMYISPGTQKIHLELYDRDDYSSCPHTPEENAMEDLSISSPNVCLESDSTISNMLLLFLLEKGRIMVYSPSLLKYVALARLPSASFSEFLIKYNIFYAISMEDGKCITFDLLDKSGHFPTILPSDSSYLLGNNGDALSVMRVAFCCQLFTPNKLNPQFKDCNNIAFPLQMCGGRLSLVLASPDQLISKIYRPDRLRELNNLLNFCYYRSFEFGKEFMRCFTEFLATSSGEIFTVMRGLLNSTFEFQICRKAEIKTIPLATNNGPLPHAETLHLTVHDHQSEFVCVFAGKRYALPKIFTLYLNDIIVALTSLENFQYKRYCIVQTLCIIDDMQLIPNFEICQLLGSFSHSEISEFLYMQLLEPSPALASAIITFEDEKLRQLGQEMMTTFFIG